MVLLYGYYGERNAGDDAFTTVCTTELHRLGLGPVGVLAAELPRVPGLPAKPLLFRRRYKGLAAFVESARIKHWLANGARVVVGGGSLFSKSAGLFELEQLLARSKVSGHRAIGVSIGPFENELAADVCARVLHRFESVGVRDLASLERAREIAPDAAVKLTFDLAPLLAPAQEASARHDPSTPQELGVALCGPALSEAQYLAVQAAAAGWLRGSGSRRVVLLPFNGHPRKGDIGVHTRLAQDLAQVGSIELHHYAGDPREMWSRIARLDGLLAMRLHAAVFGYCTGRPVLILPYEEKCTAWGQMVGQRPDFIVDASAVSTSRLELLTEVGAPVATLPIGEAIAKARTNFLWDNS